MERIANIFYLGGETQQYKNLGEVPLKIINEKIKQDRHHDQD
jgi:hypothetical protein